MGMATVSNSPSTVVEYVYVTNVYCDYDPVDEPLFPPWWKVVDGRGRRAWQRQQAREEFLRGKHQMSRLNKALRTKRARKQRMPKHTFRGRR